MGTVFADRSQRHTDHDLRAFLRWSWPPCSDGQIPESTLVQGTDLAASTGTTLYGGSNSSCIYTGDVYSCGTIFKITHKRHLTTLHSFNSTDGFLGDTAGSAQGLVQALRRQLLRNLSFGRR